MTGTSTKPIELTIVVPVLNERKLLPAFVTHLQQQWSAPHELLLIDGGSTDGSWEWLQSKFKKGIYQTATGRAQQLNFGAQKATKKWLYFVHVDSRLPKNFDAHISSAIRAGARSGCFRLKFNRANWLLKSAAAGSRWNHLLCRGGDQSLFTSLQDFNALGGYDPQYKVGEDLNLIRKLYKKKSFKVLPYYLVTSSRRFYQNGTVRLLFHFGVLHLMHWLDAKPQWMHQYYLKFVR
jgi:rSAM/selenodomain-associated transferase 2